MSKPAESKTGADKAASAPGRAGASPAKAGKEKKGRQPRSEKHVEDMLDRTSAESFPASDPPGWNAGG